MRQRTGPFLSERGRMALATALTVASALAFAAASETSGHEASNPGAPGLSHPHQPAGATSQ